MPDFIDVRVRVRKERLGDLVTEMSLSLPYAKPIGFDVVKEVVFTPVIETEPKLLSKSTSKSTSKTKGVKFHSAQQKKVFTAIQKGAVDIASISAHTGIVRANGISRILANLKKHNLIKGKEGSYEVA